MHSATRRRALIVLGVAATWLLISVVLGSQAALGMSMQGNTVSLATALRTQLINNLPWIPASLAAIALASRFPLTRGSWKRRVWIHLLAIPVVGWIANVGVVLGFWWTSGSFAGWMALARQATLWATIRIHVAATVYGATAVLTQGWIYFGQAREREVNVARLEAQLAHARFQALNEQIRPHFLFNTLHTIGQLWRSGRAEAADAMLDRLGSLFQRVRASTDRPYIPLAEELSMVRDYLAIEQERFSDRLQVEVHATPEAGACLVPPLLLQPLVENAIRHGISASPSAGRVTVTAEVARGRLVIVVDDDGPGFSNGTPSPGSGTGLANTRGRLRHAYGDAQRLTMEEDGGTRVCLELPATVDDDGSWEAVAHG